MNLNNVSATGSVVDALILCNIDMDIGDRHYIAGEPFTYLKQVNVTIDSESVSPQTTVLTPSNRGMQYVDALNYINRLTISNVSMTSKIKSLFFNNQSGEAIEWTPIADPQTRLEHPNASNPFLYEEGQLLDADQYELENNWLTILNFDEYKHYLLCYSYSTELSTFVVENYPYFKIVLFAEGNMNGKTTEQQLIFEKVSLMPQTQFAFGPVMQNNVMLVFGVIEPDKTVRLKI